MKFHFTNKIENKNFMTYLDKYNTVTEVVTKICIEHIIIINNIKYVLVDLSDYLYNKTVVKFDFLCDLESNVEMILLANNYLVTDNIKKIDISHLLYFDTYNQFYLLMKYDNKDIFLTYKGGWYKNRYYEYNKLLNLKYVNFKLIGEEHFLTKDITIITKSKFTFNPLFFEKITLKTKHEDKYYNSTKLQEQKYYVSLLHKIFWIDNKTLTVIKFDNDYLSDTDINYLYQTKSTESYIEKINAIII